MKNLITTFYTAFQNHDPETMASCYHKDIVFNDPAFENLKGEEAGNMWRMLIERSKGKLDITFRDIEANEKTGKAHWEAKYIFSQTKRKVHNIIDAEFEFKDGKIIRHTDHFNFRKWSAQALGMPGLLLGWTPFLKNKVKAQARLSLNKYMQRN